MESSSSSPSIKLSTGNQRDNASTISYCYGKVFQKSPMGSSFEQDAHSKMKMSMEQIPSKNRLSTPKPSAFLLHKASSCSVPIEKKEDQKRTFVSVAPTLLPVWFKAQMALTLQPVDSSVIEEKQSRHELAEIIQEKKFLQLLELEPERSPTVVPSKPSFADMLVAQIPRLKPIQCSGLETIACRSIECSAQKSLYENEVMISGPCEFDKENCVEPLFPLNPLTRTKLKARQGSLATILLSEKDVPNCGSVPIECKPWFDSD